MEAMAAYGWGEKTPVSEALFAAGHRFEFLQAVRLLEALQRRPADVGEGTDPAAEPVRFSSRVALGFPAGEVVTIEPPPPAGGPARLTEAFLGLAGEYGPLPQTFTELILRRQAARDHAAADFLDLFNHRLVSLFYRARKKYRPALGHRPPDEGRVARTLYAFLGLATPRLAGRMGVRDRSLLEHAGLLAGTQRSMAGLPCLLAHHFAAPVAVEPFRGAWLALDPDQHTRLGRRGQNRALGRDAVVGTRVWDQQAGFELRLGPLRLAQFLAFLPIGRASRPLVSLVRYYVGEELGFRVRLLLAPGEMPALSLGRAGDARLGWSARLAAGRGAPPATAPAAPSRRPPARQAAPEPRLGAAGGARLGWTSWLSGRWPPAGDAQVVLAGHP
jgi:type VI secretion system protein ImpH